MNAGHLFVLSAPSGTGKTTIIRRLLENELQGFGSLAFSVSHTSRPAREGERNGRDYYFVDRPTFEGMINDNSFIEWAEVYGDYKGTARREVEPRLASGVDVVLDLDVQGARQVLESTPGATGIFILPPSRAEMERRLRDRGQDSAQQIARRLSLSRWEIECYELYDYVIINDDVDRACQALAGIILERRHRKADMEGRVQAVLREFPQS